MKFFKNKLAVTASVLSVAFISLIGISAAKRDNIAIVSQVKDIAYSVNGVFYGISRNAKNAVIAIVNYDEIEKENESLKKENSILKGKLSGYGDLLTENKTLRESGNFREQRQEYNYIGADVLQIGSNGDPNILVLNQGASDGLYEGFAVIDSTGALVGTVSEVDKNYCLVETIKHQNSKVAVRIQSSQEVPEDTDDEEENNQEEVGGENNQEEIMNPEGTLNGYGALNALDSDAQIERIDIKSKVEKGNDIFTTGRGLFYPKDLLVGKVLNTTEVKGESVQLVELKSSVDFNSLQQVTIIVPKEGVGDNGEIRYEK